MNVDVEFDHYVDEELIDEHLEAKIPNLNSHFHVTQNHVDVL